MVPAGALPGWDKGQDLLRQKPLPHKLFRRPGILFLKLETGLIFYRWPL